VLDPRLDYAATLRFADPQTGEAILRIGAELRAAKPVHWEGYDEARRCWADLVADTQYSEVRVGLQLVDRGGIASDDDVIEFCRGAQSMAATLVATTDFPSRSVALRAATQLDRLCAEVDIQIGMNVVKTDGAPIPGTKVRALAESMGCVFRDDGRFVHLSSDGADLLTITNLEPTPFRAENLTRTATRAVALTLDVPRAPDADATYRQFVEAAQRIARALDGELVDDHRLPIPPPAMDAIGNAVAKARATMREASIPAGSRLARRLFA
jgi:ZipA, C-terminal FtsZ-binding domain